MSLGPGARVGPCEIIALIGTGGMGEVYRARDEAQSRRCVEWIALDKESKLQKTAVSR